MWQVVRKNVPKGYAEGIGDKFLTFTAEDEGFIVLANQKNYISLYLMPLYIFPELKAMLDDAAAGRKLKCGKSCINFRQADELPLETIASIIARCPDAGEYKAQVRQIRDGCKGNKKTIDG